MHHGEVWANGEQLHYMLEAIAEVPSLPVVNSKGKKLLTAREEQVVALVADGLSNRNVALELRLSEHTVKKYVFRIFDKLGVSSRVELVLYAMNYGIRRLPRPNGWQEDTPPPIHAPARPEAANHSIPLQPAVNSARKPGRLQPTNLTSPGRQLASSFLHVQEAYPGSLPGVPGLWGSPRKTLTSTLGLDNAKCAVGNPLDFGESELPLIERADDARAVPLVVELENFSGKTQVSRFAFEFDVVELSFVFQKVGGVVGEDVVPVPHHHPLAGLGMLHDHEAFRRVRAKFRKAIDGVASPAVLWERGETWRRDAALSS